PWRPQCLGGRLAGVPVRLRRGLSAVGWIVLSWVLSFQAASNHAGAHASCSVSDCEPGLVASLMRFTSPGWPHLTQVVLSSHVSMMRKRDFGFGASFGGSDCFAPVGQ